MEILFLTRLFYPHFGGVEKPVKELSKRLVQLGYKVTVVTTKYDNKLKKEELIEGITVIRISYPKIKYLGLISIWFWFFRNINLITNSDIVHAHGVFIWYWPFRFLLPMKPIYVTFYGWEGVFPVPRTNIFLRKIANRLAWKSVIDAKFIEKYYNIKANRIVLPATDIPRKRRCRKDKRLILYVGRLDSNTGLEKLLKSLNYLSNYSILFCGDGELRNKCSKYGKVFGFTNPYPYYRNAYFSLSPGVTSIFEAMAHKCLIVTTYDSKLKKDYILMSKYKDWIVVEKDPKKLAEKIIYYTKHPEKAKPMIEKAYNWVKNQTWERLTEDYLKLWGVK